MRLKQVKMVVGDAADISSLKLANVKLENKIFRFINLNYRAMISSLPIVNSVFILSITINRASGFGYFLWDPTRLAWACFCL